MTCTDGVFLLRAACLANKEDVVELMYVITRNTEIIIVVNALLDEGIKFTTGKHQAMLEAIDTGDLGMVKRLI